MGNNLYWIRGSAQKIKVGGEKKQQKGEEQKENR